MRLLWVIVLFGTQLISAASVAVITGENASFSSSCSAGTRTANPCPPGIPGATGGLYGPDYIVNADAGPSPVGPPTQIPGASTVSIGADGGALYSCLDNFPCPPFVPLSSSSEASETISGYTNGPIRLGLIRLSMAVGWNHISAPNVAISDGIHGYGFGDGAPPGSINPCCGGAYDATLPFLLGGPFEVSASANAGSSVPSCPVGSYPVSCGSGTSADAAISFVLLEPDGSSIPFGSATTPEPATCALCTLGLLFAFLRARRLRS